MEEKPLVSIGDIARHLNVSKYLARKTLKDYHVATFYLGRCISVYPSTLKKCLEFTQNGINSPSNDTK